MKTVMASEPYTTMGSLMSALELVASMVGTHPAEIPVTVRLHSSIRSRVLLLQEKSSDGSIQYSAEIYSNEAQ